MASTEQSGPGPSAILLAYHRKPIDTIPRDHLQRIMRTDLQHSLISSTPRYRLDQEMLVYNIKDITYVVEFLLHWVKNMDVAESLRVCMESANGKEYMEIDQLCEPGWVPEDLRVFHRIFQHFSNMTAYTSDIHDSMVDWYIAYLKGNSNDLGDIFMTCRRNDKVGDGCLIRVCANLLVHHGKALLDPKTQNDCRFWLRDHIRQGVRSRIPGDVMDPAFNHHCAYHQHGENEICYKQKIQQTVDLPFR